MKVITGKVVNGRVELPPGEVPEGESVAVLASDGDAVVKLSPDDERELLDRIGAITRGEFVDGDEFFKNLKAPR